MNIYILTHEPIPEGMAASNRILSYSKGLAELNQYVKILSFKPSVNNHFPAKGLVNNVHYQIITGLRKIPKFKISLPIYIVYGIINSITILKRSKLNGGGGILILVSNKPIIFLCYYVVAKLLKYNYLIEKSELPFVLTKQTVFGQLYAKIYANFFYRVFDGAIVMTNVIKEYLSLKLRKRAKIFHLPMTVEMERFNNAEPIFDFEYIAYCGNMSKEKDGVHNLIQAFVKVASIYPSIRLVLIGDGSENEMNEYQSMAEELGIENRMILTGQVSRNEMPQYLCNAKILALARPTGLQSSGGFPSKLGEYLSTGIPVVTTSTGEISNYLTNERSAYLCEPDNTAAFSQCLTKALSDYQKATKIGKEGKKVAEKHFNYNSQSKDLLNYLYNLS